MRKVVACALSLLLLPAAVFATAQTPDRLFYKGKERALFANPLEDFYEGKTRPNFFIEPGAISSGCWRGYVAHWKIEEDQLFLTGIDSWICRGFTDAGCKKVDLKELFGAKFDGGRVSADWFSGLLRIPDGEELQYVHMGYGSVYERDIVLKVEKGRVTAEEIIDNTKRALPSPLELQRLELEKMKSEDEKKKKPTKKDNR